MKNLIQTFVAILVIVATFQILLHPKTSKPTRYDEETGAGKIVNRYMALGNSTNEFKIRDEDLKKIEQSLFTPEYKKLLIKIAQDKQNIILHSNDLDWIKTNARETYVRLTCFYDYEAKLVGNKSQPKFMNSFLDTEERAILYTEFDVFSGKLNLNNFPLTNEEKQKYCFN